MLSFPDTQFCKQPRKTWKLSDSEFPRWLRSEWNEYWYSKRHKEKTVKRLKGGEVSPYKLPVCMCVHMCWAHICMWMHICVWVYMGVGACVEVRGLMLKGSSLPSPWIPRTGHKFRAANISACCATSPALTLIVVTCATSEPAMCLHCDI